MEQCLQSSFYFAICNKIILLKNFIQKKQQKYLIHVFFYFDKASNKHYLNLNLTQLKSSDKGNWFEQPISDDLEQSYVT